MINKDVILFKEILLNMIKTSLPQCCLFLKKSDKMELGLFIFFFYTVFGMFETLNKDVGLSLKWM